MGVFNVKNMSAHLIPEVKKNILSFAEIFSALLDVFVERILLILAKKKKFGKKSMCKNFITQKHLDFYE